MFFVSQATGERKAFFPDGYTVDTATQWNERFRSQAHFSFLRAQDGYRIDRKPDGSYRDKWGGVWVPEESGC